jgi:hypothetical protein
MASQSADPGGDRNQDRPLRSPSRIPSWKGSLAPFAANVWITCCSGRVQIWRINCWISGPTTSTTIVPITHRKGERPICQCHHPPPICARFAGSHTVEVYIGHPWPLEFSKMCAACDMQVSVGKNFVMNHSRWSSSVLHRSGFREFSRFHCLRPIRQPHRSRQSRLQLSAHS